MEYDDVIVTPALEGPAMNFMYQYTSQVGVLSVSVTIVSWWCNIVLFRMWRMWSQPSQITLLHCWFKPLTCLLREQPISHVHDVPQMGYYCIYRRRQPGQLNYNVKNEGVYQSYKDLPDCANIAAIARKHALQLTAAGIDHVMVVSSRPCVFRNIPAMAALIWWRA
jgi:hypothetical protein